MTEKINERSLLERQLENCMSLVDNISVKDSEQEAKLVESFNDLLHSFEVYCQKVDERPSSTDITRLVKKLQQTREELEQTKRERNKHESKFIKLEQSVKSQSEKMNLLLDAQKSHASEVQSLEAQIHVLEQRIERHQSIESEHDSLSIQHQEQSQKVMALQRELVKLKDVQADLKQLQEDSEAQHQQLVKARSELDSTANQLKEAEAQTEKYRNLYKARFELFQRLREDFDELMEQSYELSPK